MSNSSANAESLETYTIKGSIKIVERLFNLPLDYNDLKGAKIQIFARHCIPLDKAKDPKDEAKLPYLVYLNGGPGFELPLKGPSGLAGELYKQGYQVLWLDQRGTGLSTTVSPDTVPAHVTTAQEIAQYLKHFRADNIVKDCEAIRQILLGGEPDAEDRKWTIMGQSFGGFVSLTYLSFYPEGLKEVFITGGLAPVTQNDPDIVYQNLVRRVAKRNEIYYQKYPADIARVRKIVLFLESNKVILPNGGQLTTTRFQALGIAFGMHGGIDNVHQVVLRASNDLEVFKKLSFKTLAVILGSYSFDGNPLYAIVHEAIYCQGRPSRWSAKRALQANPHFSWDNVKTLQDSEPLYFLGEMVLPDIFDDYVNLRPWKEAAHILAEDESWEPLYDLDQLARNQVKVSAVTYFDDMYVDFELAQETASKVKNVEQYITNQLMHNGLDVASEDVTKRLFQLSKREYD